MNRKRVYIGVVIIVLVLISFLSGTKPQITDKEQISQIQAVSGDTVIHTPPADEESQEPSQAVIKTPAPESAKETNPTPKKTITPTPDNSPKPTPISEEKTDQTPKPEGELTCSLSVSCASVLDNMDKLKEGKAELIPKDGVIYPEQTVVFYVGESVFNVLLREMKKNKIHLEFVDTPMYNSTYIEGIGNLYEFDCTELSGWRFRVNGEFPNYSCSKYELCDGDRIEWVYTCDWGKDIGAYKGE